ncbi:MAG TPA: DUF6209 family protein [Thermoanaerobaculia bacterium]|jgi:hypothetical protein
MVKRFLTGHPRVSFTCNHWINLTGALKPGGRCVIAYDPTRIVPPGDPYRFGDPNRPVTAGIRFHPTGEETVVTLVSAGGIIENPEIDPSGAGSMLFAEIRIPEEVDELEFWFSFVDHLGTTVWDSNGGHNHHVRFPAHDIKVEKATLVNDPQSPFAKLSIAVTTQPEVDSVTARYRIVNDPTRGDTTTEYKLKGEGGGAWAAGAIPVPHGATVLFDVVYTARGREFVDNNAGHSFLARTREQDS